jgi:hypothetical protein
MVTPKKLILYKDMLHYSSDLQSKPLEQVNLSPRVVPSPSANKLLIPSPRHSPRISLSSSLEYMGVPTPHHQRQADFAEAAIHELPADVGLRANAPQQQGQVMSRLAVCHQRRF